MIVSLEYLHPVPQFFKTLHTASQGHLLKQQPFIVRIDMDEPIDSRSQLQVNIDRVFWEIGLRGSWVLFVLFYTNNIKCATRDTGRLSDTPRC